MRAIILAAGRGSRLERITEDRPKCLVELKGRPLLRYQIEALKAAGIKDISIVRGYRKEMLSFLDLVTFDNDRWPETNMVASLACAREWLLLGPCIVSYSDIVYLPDHVSALMAAEGDMAVTVDLQWRTLWEARSSSPLLDAETLRVAEDGSLIEIGKSPKSFEEVEAQYMGLVKITSTGWRWIETLLGSLEAAVRDKMDMTSMLSMMIEAKRSIYTVPIAGEWLEVDTADDLALYETSYIETVTKKLYDFVTGVSQVLR